jgi:asparagine synthase (glutamine-hydrolysing)
VCGIAGIVRTEHAAPDDVQTVRGMLSVLAHRGPDDEHYMCDDRAAIGARRLSIIDLETGRQPLTDESGGIWVTQNGEIYNYLELRERLEERGHTLSTSGDTEVIAHLYEDYGDEFVLHLRGMFAIALWDQPRRRLVLARDRVGKKPLYWHLSNGRLTYASELKALMGPAGVPRDIDADALALYLQYQYVPSPLSILRNVQKLPPASLLSWDGGPPVVKQYWRLDYTPKDEGRAGDQADKCLELLRESVRLRLRSDVPVGVFLSGGMDSSVVTAVVAEASATPVRTLSIGFEERSFDELPYARQVAREFGADHLEDVVTLDAVGILPALAYQFDEPFGDSSALPTYRVAQLAQGLKVVLTGDGGDESFAGYDRYRLQAVLSLLDRAPRFTRAAAAAIAPVVLTAMRRRPREIDWQSMAGLDFDHRYVALMSIFHPKSTDRVLANGIDPNRDSYLLERLAASPRTSLDRLLATDVKTYLAEDLLVKVDRATMANSLEARSPLLDHKMMEFAATLPEHRKLGHLGRSKAIFREVAYRLMPRSFVERPKMGFGVPLGSWFNSALGDLYTELVLAPDSASRDLVSQEVAMSLLARHRAGRGSYSHRLWMLLMLELWCRTWQRGPVGTLS